LDQVAYIRDRLLKPGGILYLAVPTGPDSLFWNAHRQYGKFRYKRLMTGWNLLGIYDGGLNQGVDLTKYSLDQLIDAMVDPKNDKVANEMQPVFALQKPL